jgi:DNA-binding IclR family transcriptional regulator
LAGNSSDAGRSVTSKVVAILQTFTSGSGHSLTEISHLTGLPISTVHRLASELAAWGMLDRTDDSNYRVGLPLRIIGGHAGHPPTVQERARCLLQDLAATTGTDVRLGVLTDTTVAFIEKAAGHRATSSFSPAATRPAHATAMGKALLAFSPSRTVDAVIARGLKGYTPYTLTSPDRLRRVLAGIRLNALAVSRWELQLGVSAIAAPLFGPGGIVVAAIEMRVSDLRKDLPRFQPALIVATRSLSRQMCVPPVARGVAAIDRSLLAPAAHSSREHRAG